MIGIVFFIPQLPAAEKLTEYLTALGSSNMSKSFLISHILCEISTVVDQLWQAFQVPTHLLLTALPLFCLLLLSWLSHSFVSLHRLAINWPVCVSVISSLSQFISTVFHQNHTEANSLRCRLFYLTTLRRFIVPDSPTCCHLRGLWVSVHDRTNYRTTSGPLKTEKLKLKKKGNGWCYPLQPSCGASLPLSRVRLCSIMPVLLPFRRDSRQNKSYEQCTFKGWLRGKLKPLFVTSTVRNSLVLLHHNSSILYSQGKLWWLHPLHTVR